MLEITLQEIVSSGLCSGCGACVAILSDDVLEMRMCEEGYLRPYAKRNLSTRDQAKLRSCCPGIGLAHSGAFDFGVKYDPIWGPIVSLAAGHAFDPEVRRTASSGGVLSALLIHLLESGKVDFVVHTRSSTENPLKNETAFSRTRSDVLRAAGSRYSPAAPVAELPRALAQGGRFAFVGKPCDVAAVRKICCADPVTAGRIPYLLSFMCAGTPGLDGTFEILKQLQISPQDVISFRYRGEGWPGKARATMRDGQTRSMTYNMAWGSILNRYLQARCKMCADGTGEFADVVCADAWFGKNGYPDFAEADGRSLVISRTQRGQNMVDAALGRQCLELEAFPLDNLAEIQPYQQNRKQTMRARLLAATLLHRRHPEYGGFALKACARSLSWRASAKAFFGTAKRILSGSI